MTNDIIKMTKKIPFRFKVESFTDEEFREACGKVIKESQITDELLAILKKFAAEHQYEGSPDPEDPKLPEWFYKDMSTPEATYERWGYAIKVLLQQKEAEKNEIYFDALDHFDSEIYYDAKEHFVESPLEPFSIIPILDIIPLALGLFVFLVFILIALRKVWKNRSENVTKSSGP